MSQFGELVEATIIKDRITKRSRGFGYVTFSSLEDAKKAMAAEHVINGRTLDVKVATPKASGLPELNCYELMYLFEDMVPPFRKSTRIFVARIPSSVTDDIFHSYFSKYGAVIDAYMPKDPVTKQHRGIGFVTYENEDSVDQLMSESHELGGSTIAVDRATPKEESRGYRMYSQQFRTPRSFVVSPSTGYEYVDSASRVEHPTTNILPCGYISQDGIPSAGQILIGGDVNSAGSNNNQVVLAAPRVEKKMFVGRIPLETTAEDLQAYFSQFGWVTDVYLPKDPKKISHRGFGFVTFADEATAARVARVRHFLHGREIAVDSASPSDRLPGGGQGVQELSSAAAASITGNDASLPLSSGSTKWGKKLFVGRIPLEATSNDLRIHFSQFGPVLDVYLPKASSPFICSNCQNIFAFFFNINLLAYVLLLQDGKKISHRGFGFVTFADEISAEYASQKVHMILGQKVVFCSILLP
ncbi:putative RNA-binding protein [Nymphaea thermarum]|nr:putative RNA-binding protein [Nymphaea thermarum]